LLKGRDSSEYPKLRERGEWLIFVVERKGRAVDNPH